MSMNYNTASVSEVEDGTTQESLYSEVSKLRLKDAVICYQGLLAQNNLFSSESSASISHEAMLMAEEIFQNTLAILAEKIIVSDEELIHENERSAVFLCWSLFQCRQLDNITEVVLVLRRGEPRRRRWIQLSIGGTVSGAAAAGAAQQGGSGFGRRR
ncbi:hypothetical protein AVEN_90562-1 [Araneus ventricosus]|uniref:Uncharacterized protein n=1 Tax=Araneus ventricosus TaxID=182803 RepID=A0A4Y2NMZ4_ARAVE|nr:hypothetical protein AVEN_90562-1 [Araneus ventricosus]